MRRKRKNTLKKAGALGGLVALAVNSLSPLTEPDNSKNHSQPIVEWGKIGYSDGGISTHHVDICSVVILDFGDDGLMAHAYPSDHPKARGLSWERNGLVNATTVVEGLLYEVRSRGLNIDQATAIVDSGVESDLSIIKNNLTNAGIPIVSVKYNWGKNTTRNIFYGFKTGELDVKYNRARLIGDTT